MSRLYVTILTIFVVVALTSLVAKQAEALDGSVQELKIKKTIGLNWFTGQKVVDRNPIWTGFRGFWDLSELNFSRRDWIKIIITGKIGRVSDTFLRTPNPVSDDVNLKKVVCRNKTTGQKVMGTIVDKHKWKCEDLDYSFQDIIKIVISAKARRRSR